MAGVDRKRQIKSPCIRIRIIITISNDNNTITSTNINMCIYVFERECVCERETHTQTRRETERVYNLPSHANDRQRRLPMRVNRIQHLTWRATQNLGW